ncbi:hypothetical protein HNQ56_004391 [Anaerotaenia torta]|uniref:hypothetical protein n=1 Tax=Anaerotaenia torta TaxID=433293 RepID=UPI003D19E9EF
MQYIITGNNGGQRITRTAANDFLAFTIIGQLSQDGVTDICMREVKQEEPKVQKLPEQEPAKSSQVPARMRTITQVLEYFKQEDPESSISEYYLRGLIKQGKVPVFYAGRKCLVNLDRLIEYLNSGLPEAEPEPVKKEYGRLRRVGD